MVDSQLPQARAVLTAARLVAALELEAEVVESRGGWEAKHALAIATACCVSPIIRLDGRLGER